MKMYQKVYEDLMRDSKFWQNSSVDSAHGTLEELTTQFQDFLNKTYRDLHHIALCYLWLEKQLLFNGERRIRRFRSAKSFDVLFARYMNEMVGRDQATLTRSRWFQLTAAIAWEFYPDFFKHNPFENPEYYQWPYEYVGLDFLQMVYQMDEKKELLDYAEKKRMKFRDFKNWVTNYALCYNDEQGEIKYEVTVGNDRMVYIRKVGYDYTDSANSLQKLLPEYHESKKA